MTTINCPLCSGNGKNFDGSKACPECKGTGKVTNVFAELVHGRYETAEETAAAEGTTVDEERKRAVSAKEWIAKNAK